MINNDCKGTYINKGETKNCSLGLNIETFPADGTKENITANITYITTLEYDLATGHSKGSKKTYSGWFPIILESEVTDVSYEYEYCTHWVEGMKEPVIYECPGKENSECPSGCECMGKRCKRKKRIDNTIVKVTIYNKGDNEIILKDLKLDGTTCSGSIPAGGKKTCGPYVKEPGGRVQVDMEYQSSVTFIQKITFSK